MPRTRVLERKDLIRSSVANVELESVNGGSLLFNTTAKSSRKKEISSADSEMLQRTAAGADAQDVKGRLQIDAVADDILRVRYATVDRDPVPETSRMLVAAPPQADSVDVSREQGAVRMTTARAVVTVRLNPFQIEIEDDQGNAITQVSGPERNYFHNWDSYNTGVNQPFDGGIAIATERFTLRPDEAIYGLGESFIRLNKVGQTLDLDIQDALGACTPRSYKSVPFFVSSHGYGVFFNHSCPMTYWIGSLCACDIQVAAEDDYLDYFIILGDIRHVLSRYTDLTGKGVMPPTWSFGYWQSKISYTAADETLEIARKLRENEVPCDVIHLDTHWFKADWYCDLTFDKERFPDPKAYLDELASMGFKVSLWQLPYIPEGSELFDELKAVDGFVKNQKGEIYDCGICFTPGFEGVVGVVDFTNPAAVKVHQEWFAKLFRMGAKVVKTDFGESAPADGVYHDGTPGHQMHNLYPLLYNTAVSEVTERETGDGIVWARSAWAGSQRLPVHWGGDNSPNWENMIPQIEGGLSLGLSGFQFWSQDIGGFLGTTGGDLLVRWMQTGMFLSHSRIHGSGDRELYKFEPQVQDICRKYIQLRYQLLPYILGSAQWCVDKSLPMARALVVDFQDDPATWSISDEFIFGRGILVAPITNPQGRRRIYLPAGTAWYDWWTGERLDGGQWLEVDVDLETLPLYVREGTIVPMCPVMNYADEKRPESYTVKYAPLTAPGESTFTVHTETMDLDCVYRFDGDQHTLETLAADAQTQTESIGK